MPEEKKTPERFKIPDSLKDKIVHSMDHIQAFDYHGRRIVLRKQNERQLLKLATAKDCAVLQLKDKAAPKSAPAPAASSSTKETESKDSKKAETSAKK